jgi:DNA-binding LacI/PurR family transcriptional regulator
MTAASSAPEAKPIRPRSRPTVGFTVLWSTDNNYGGPIWQGAIDAAQEADINLLAFTGKRYRREGLEGYFPEAVGQMNATTVDGMIVVSSSLASIRQLGGYGAFPVVTISESNPECPGVISDNESGIHAAMTHLIKEHGYRRIAFIKGVEDDMAAIARLHAYTEALRKHDLPQDDQLILPGSYDIVSGEAAASLLLEQQARFEAIIAANDLMAIGAMHTLQKQGVRVPYDVAVIGFDDAREAHYTTPPLTTVRQPLYGMGRRAVELMLARLRDEIPPAEEVLPTELVIRQSCGCLSADVQQAASRSAGEHIGGLRDWLGSAFRLPSVQRSSITADMKHTLDALSAGLDADWAEQLLDAFLNDINHPVDGAFLAVVDKISRQIMAQLAPVSALQGPLSALRRHIQPQDSGNRRAEDLLQQARVFLGEAALRQQEQQRAQDEAENDVLSQIGGALITTFDVTKLMDLIARELSRFDIHQCYIALYEDPGHPPDYARLVLAQSDGQRIPLPLEGQRILTRDLLPAELLPKQRFQLLVMPLYFSDEWLGFVVFEISLQKRVRTVYEVLRSQLSSALKGAQLSRHVAGNSQEVNSTST